MICCTAAVNSLPNKIVLSSLALIQHHLSASKKEEDKKGDKDFGEFTERSKYYNATRRCERSRCAHPGPYIRICEQSGFQGFSLLIAWFFKEQLIASAPYAFTCLFSISLLTCRKVLQKTYDLSKDIFV